MKQKRRKTQHPTAGLYNLEVKAPPPTYPFGRITLDDGTRLVVTGFQQSWPEGSSYSVLTISAVAEAALRLPVP